MLPSGSRLRRSSDIQRVQRRGRSAHGQWYSLRFLPNTSSRSRATVVVSQRVSKKAVIRNRIKRRTRVLIQPLLKTLRLPQDVLVSVRSGAVDQTTDMLKQELHNLFAKIQRS